MKKIEINRIYKCFIEKDYENIYHTSIDTVLAALIGLDEKDTEVNKKIYNIWFRSVKNNSCFAISILSLSEESITNTTAVLLG